MIDAWFTPESGLAGLFAASFLAATLLPGGSEILLFGLLKLYPQVLWPALFLATLGNTLGGLTSVWLGRLVPAVAVQPAGWQLARRHGAVILLLAWLPVLGDVLCVAAGWLRLPWLPVALFMALGKGLRYLMVAWLSTAAFN